MKMNKVLALCLSPDQGGLELYILKLLKYYNESGQNITVACSKGSYISKNINSNKIECYSSGLFKKVFNFFMIRKHIIDNNLTIIHVSWSKDIFLSIMLKIFTPGAIKVIFYRQMKISRSKKDMYHKLIYRHIDSIMVITDKLKAEAMKKRFNQIALPEKDEHKKSKEYKKLSPAMRKAVDHIFGIMDAKPSDFLNSFEKTIKDAARKFKVRENELMKYFEREMLGEYQWQ